MLFSTLIMDFLLVSIPITYGLLYWKHDGANKKMLQPKKFWKFSLIAIVPFFLATGLIYYFF